MPRRRSRASELLPADCRDGERNGYGSGLSAAGKPAQPGTCAFLAAGGLAAGGGMAAGDWGAPAPSPQHTSALAWQVCSSKTMKLRKRSHFTSFLPTVYLAMPCPLVQSAMYLSSSFLASLVGPSLP